jgi:hypothetical protein
MKPVILVLAITALSIASAHGQPSGHDHPSGVSEEGLGRAHMDTSCAPAVAAEFDRSLALLHNFWYVRAFGRFNQIAKDDPECAMAYWGAAMTYNQKTASDTPELQARHVRGRTIYAVPDRVVYGYFDMLTRLIVETGQWDKVDAIPIVAPSRDFEAVKLQWEAKSAAVRKDPGAAQAAAR